MNNEIPLCVDLDGTLIYTDMLHESAFLLIKVAPFSLMKIPFILLVAGKAKLKQWIANQIEFDPAVLPYNQDVIVWLRTEHESGRRLILCTASDLSLAEPISTYLGFFDEIMASDGITNLEGVRKGAALVDRFGEQGFDYVGNSTSDLDVWRHARKATVVNATSRLASEVSTLVDIERVFEGLNIKFIVWAKVLRIHQWIKNVLLLVPMLAAHRLFDSQAWLTLLWAFVAFSLCASSVYITNDLLDLESDRQHPRKFKRPFASGAIPVLKGAVLSPILVALSCVIAAYVGRTFLSWLLIYFILTCLYSLKLKQVVLVDCLTLAILYTLRVVAGAGAIGSTLTFWLIGFSLFLFLSLAFVKRFVELKVQHMNEKQKVHGRGYFVDDAPLIQTIGVSAGFISCLILALYLNSPEITKLYIHPEWIWGTVPVLVFWVSWLWLRAYRGEMHDDPLVFAVKDRVSLAAGLVFVLFLLLGSVTL